MPATPLLAPGPSRPEDRKINVGGSLDKSADRPDAPPYRGRAVLRQTSRRILPHRICAKKKADKPIGKLVPVS